MCGICGVVEARERPQEAALAARARAMAEALRHRGPDAGGVWVDAAAGVALGHRRLAVLDPSPAGAQPMRSACGRWVLVFNGEIANFRELRAELEGLGHGFRGHSDTEVLAEALSRWGVEGALDRLWGMFAFAAWDRTRRVLALARDRLGEKPLYYGWQGGRFLFGSQLAALRAHPGFRAEVDRGALALLVQYSYVPAPHAIFEGVAKLEAGTWLEVDPARPADEPAPRVYWSARAAVEAGAAAPWRGGAAEAADALEELLRDAVRRRLVADVPVGALLSGGIDSSTLVALMRACGAAPLRTFTIGFREPAFDESAHARAVARHLGTEHHEWILTADDARAAIPRLPAVYDEPFADTSQLPTLLVCQLARRHVTVALSGDGGDELFAGYDRPFRCLARWRALGALPAPLRAALARSASGLARAGAAAGGPRALGRLERAAEQLGADSLPDLFARMNARCPDPARLVVGGQPASCLLRDPSRWARVADPAAWMAHVDLAGRLPEGLLVKLDRASMAAGLEARCPLLDHRVVEFALRLPRDLLVRGGERKWLLRRVLARHLPPALFERPKQGFGVPLGAWLRGPLRGWAEALLAEPRLRAAGYLHAPAVRQIWTQHLAGWRDHRFLLWNLLSFEAWLDECMGKSPPAC